MLAALILGGMAVFLGFNCGNYGGVQNNSDPCQLIMTVGSL